MNEVIARFEQKYEDLYGEGAGASETGFELVTLRVDGYGSTTKPELEATERADATGPAETETILWPEEGRRLETDVFYADDVGPGAEINGPAVLRLENTTVAVPNEDYAEIVGRNNITIKTE